MCVLRVVCVCVCLWGMVLSSTCVFPVNFWPLSRGAFLSLGLALEPSRILTADHELYKNRNKNFFPENDHFDILISQCDSIYIQGDLPTLNINRFTLNTKLRYIEVFGIF